MVVLVFCADEKYLQINSFEIGCSGICWLPDHCISKPSLESKIYSVAPTIACIINKAAPLAIVTKGFGGAFLLLNALESLRKFNPKTDLDVIVLDGDTMIIDELVNLHNCRVKVISYSHNDSR